MKKRHLPIFILITISIFFYSCNDNIEEEIEEICTGDNSTIAVERLLTKLTTIHPGYLPTTRNYEYSYNEYNLLTLKKEYTFDYDLYRNYKYCINNLTEIENNSKSLRYQFKYDTSNRIVSYRTTNSYLHDYELLYNANKITVSGIINKKMNQTFVLETNNIGLVTKITRENGYTNFGYDINGNLIEITDLDNTSETPLKEYEIIYDANPNPFYGQLQSSYLVNFIDYFASSAIFGVDVFFRFDQSKFPYLKNNPVLLKFKNCSNCYSNLIERTYEYDSQNYPIKMEESYVGAPAIVYEFEYN